MADAFLRLSAKDRRDALSVAADRAGRPAHLLEKDVWVVWALATLYGSALGEHLVFKGTSFSKAYQVIRRFSEDVDLTYDIGTRSACPWRFKAFRKRCASARQPPDAIARQAERGAVATVIFPYLVALTANC